MLLPTILVVDDEQLIRWALNDRLTHEGYKVIEAETAKAALETKHGETTSGNPHHDSVRIPRK